MGGLPLGRRGSDTRCLGALALGSARGTDGEGGPLADLSRVWPPLICSRLRRGGWGQLGTASPSGWRRLSRRGALPTTLAGLQLEDLVEARPRQGAQPFDHGDASCSVLLAGGLLG